MRPLLQTVLGLAATCAMAGLMLAAPVGVLAQSLVPEDFFNAPIDPSAPTEVEADQLTFDSVANVITATGDVVLRVGSYTIAGQRLVYRRTGGEMEVQGGVTVTDPSGNVATSETLQLTGGLRRAVLDALTITAYDGSRITADSAEFDQELRSILTNASYAPCGDCIDDKGRRIGWSISAASIVQNAEDGSVTLEQPTISLLGMPVAWLPYLWLPDLSRTAFANVAMPSVGFSEEIGLKVEVPVTVYSTSMTDIILTPTLVTRQGFLMGAEWVQRFDNGSMRIKASGLYQFDPNAFNTPEARRDWRGAIQTQGEFVPVEDWTVGFSYSSFTDRTYFEDYQLDPRRAGINEVYATHVTADTYVDARLQQYNLLGDDTDQAPDQQGIALPNLRLERTFTLPEGAGRIDVEARMLNIYRERDYTRTVNGVPYDYGYAGARAHGMAQASWQNQFIGGGLVATPFLGVRLDAANYNSTSLLATAPASGTLLSATPIAALDIRYPLVARSPGMTHLVEPIAQLVYRGATSIQPGITNEDSQSIVFDDTNLFSYNRFTGIDRQETGLRLNVGGRYLANFDNGNYVELVAGQSFQLAGINAFADPNLQQAGLASGLDTDASYAVLGAYGVVAGNFKLGGKVQVDTSDLSLARAGLGASYGQDGWSGALHYRYAEATPETGNIQALHEVGAEAKVPVTDYWSVSANYYHDLAANSWLQAGGGLSYNDGYLAMGADLVRTGPTHRNPDDLRATVTLRLLAPAGLDLGYTSAVPVQNWFNQTGQAQ